MENSHEIVAGLLQELRRGTIVLGVLSCLSRPVYGYSLIQELASGGIGVEANTLYPLLRRLEKQGLLESRWETDGPKPRKYYEVSSLGKEVFLQLRRHWYDTVASMDTMLSQEDSCNG